MMCLEFKSLYITCNSPNEDKKDKVLLLFKKQQQQQKSQLNEKELLKITILP